MDDPLCEPCCSIDSSFGSYGSDDNGACGSGGNKDDDELAAAGPGGSGGGAVGCDGPGGMPNCICIGCKPMSDLAVPPSGLDAPAAAGLASCRGCAGGIECDGC